VPPVEEEHDRRRRRVNVESGSRDFSRNFRVMYRPDSAPDALEVKHLRKLDGQKSPAHVLKFHGNMTYKSFTPTPEPIGSGTVGITWWPMEYSPGTARSSQGGIRRKLPSC
jgi:hypothetical protein